METGKWTTYKGGIDAVQVKKGFTGMVLVRQGEHPGADVLAFSASEWEAFLEGVRAGVFDL